MYTHLKMYSLTLTYKPINILLLQLGILLGMEDVGWTEDTTLVTMETEGSNCFNEALKSRKIVTLEAIKSIAKSLGALSVSTRLFEMSQDSKFKIKSQTVTDQEALDSCLNFARNHR